MPDIHACRKISQHHTLCRNSLFSQSSQGLAGLERVDKSKEEQVRGCLLLRLPQIIKVVWLIIMTIMFLLVSLNFGEQWVDYKQSLFFLSPSSKTHETRKWPRPWLKAQDGPPSFLASHGFAAWHSHTCALPSLNLMKKRDCTQSKQWGSWEK